jgi:hypothetical protein
MSKTSQKIDIDSLPLSLKKEMADFVAFLKMKSKKNPPLNKKNLVMQKGKFNYQKTLMNL